MEIHWKSLGRNEVFLNLTIANESIESVKMRAIGDLSFLQFCQEMKQKLTGEISTLPTVPGTSTVALIWREIIAKIQNQWKLPVAFEEICHCRQVSTQKVDEAIVYGAHGLNEVRRQTSANTGCGTCLNEIESLFEYRLGKKPH